ncbi:hypothetical protein LCGC14_3106170, partial [marine sediment metagenome]
MDINPLGVPIIESIETYFRTKKDSTDDFIQNSILGVDEGNSKIIQGYKNLFNVGYGSEKDL